MPTKPKRLCPTCGRKVRGSCTECRKRTAQQHDRYRGTSASRGYDARWTEYSKQYRREHPLCVDCLARGVITPVAVVGHVKPAGHFPELFWDSQNHKAQCVACNKAQEVEDAKRYKVGKKS